MNSKRKGISNLNSNVFYCLSKYPPNAKRDPEENFFTEALAFVLKNDKEFCSNFLKKLLGIDFKEEYINDIEIETQKTFKIGKRTSYYIDICISYKEKFIIFIENKIESRINNTQIEKYINTISSLRNFNTKKFFVFYLYYNREYKKAKKEGIDIEYFKWYEIFKILEENNNPWVQQLKEFMEVKGMNEKITLKDFENMNYIFLNELLYNNKENDKTIKELKNLKKRIKIKFNNFLKNLHEKIKEKWQLCDERSLKWGTDIYQWFIFREGNNKLNLNLTMTLSPNGLSISLWLPFKVSKGKKVNNSSNVNEVKLGDILRYNKNDFNNLIKEYILKNNLFDKIILYIRGYKKNRNRPNTNVSGWRQFKNIELDLNPTLPCIGIYNSRGKISIRKKFKDCNNEEIISQIVNRAEEILSKDKGGFVPELYFQKDYGIRYLINNRQEDIINNEIINEIRKIFNNKGLQKFIIELNKLA